MRCTKTTTCLLSPLILAADRVLYLFRAAMQRCSLYQLGRIAQNDALRTSTRYSTFNLPPLRCHHSTVSTSPPRGYTSPSASSSTTSSLQPCITRSTINPKPSLYVLRPQHVRHVHSASSNKWLSRQSNDRFSREAKVQDLKSRAAFKLLQINERHHMFKPGMTVVDLGYAPGSWSQVAIDLVRPGLGRVIGVDVIPVQPPKGVSGIQGDFLSPEVQARVREFVREEDRGRVSRAALGDEPALIEDQLSFLDRERSAAQSDASDSTKEEDYANRCVDIVLSDMSAPWDITSGLGKNILNNPYRRMMNTTGNKFRDHAGSMDLCRSALYFAYETLKVGGHFVCKFYQGAEDKSFEKQLKAMFSKVHREKPESSRAESREGFFVGIKRLAKVDKTKVFDEGG